MILVAEIVAGISIVAILLRALKIAQLEHYIPGSVSTTLRRWYTVLPTNYALLAIAVLGIVWVIAADDAISNVGAIVAAVALMLAPLSLSLRGLERTAKFTRRLQVVTAFAVLLVVLVTVGLGLLPGVGFPAGLAVTALLSPFLVDVALLITVPIESALGEKYATAASTALAKVGPTVVAITGSFGKTTTKEYLAELLRGVRPCVPSPASFNNKAGLSRAVSENLEPGTEIFVAEMGTYGAGEIAALTRYFPPDVSVFCAIGPVHLERMKTISAIVAAKSEIFQPGKPAVINVDYPELAGLAGRVEGSPVVTVGTSGTSDVDVRVYAGAHGFDIDVRGEKYFAPHSEAPTLDAGNLACALGAVLALEIPIEDVVGNIERIARPKNRRVVGTASGGWRVIDDTFNSNPAGARAAVAELARVAPDGAKVVVTPGMVELGVEQADANAAWIASSSGKIDRLIVVGRTNRTSLNAGAQAASIPVEFVDRREDAVQTLRTQLHEGDGVLYENDLPIHYP